LALADLEGEHTAVHEGIGDLWRRVRRETPCNAHDAAGQQAVGQRRAG
jgi:hypothetical protein